MQGAKGAMPDRIRPPDPCHKAMKGEDINRATKNIFWPTTGIQLSNHAGIIIATEISAAVNAHIIKMGLSNMIRAVLI